MKEYLLGTMFMAQYADTLGFITGAKGYSSLLSPYLTNGSLSVRMLYREVLDFKKNTNIYFASNKTEKWNKAI